MNGTAILLMVFFFRHSENKARIRDENSVPTLSARPLVAPGKPIHNRPMIHKRPIFQLISKQTINLLRFICLADKMGHRFLAAPVGVEMGPGI